MTADQDNPGNTDIRKAIIAFATERGPGKTICPSEVARHLGGQDESVWRPLMPAVRRLAVKLVGENRIEIRKGGEVVDPETIEGIYRIAIKK